MTTAVESRTPLTAADRCDRCGAQAYVRVRLITGELHFCAHHAKQFEPNLKKKRIWVSELKRHVTVKLTMRALKTDHRILVMAGVFRSPGK